MQEENQPVQPAAPESGVKVSGTDKKDFLAPALVFIALFFSFFVLVTMQRLSQKYTGKDAINAAIESMETSNGVTNNIPETTQTPKVPLEEQINLDNSQDTKKVGDDLITEIDKSGTEELDDTLDPTSLDDLKQ